MQELQPTKAEISEAYKANKYGQAYDLAKARLAAMPDEEVLMIVAWSSYRLNYAEKQFSEAKAIARKVGEMVGIELLGQIAAVEGDMKELERLVALAPDKLANQIIVAARAPDSTIDGPVVMDLAHLHGTVENGLKGAHIQHNAGRFFLAKCESPNCLEIAQSYLEEAIKMYGTETNWNHRAAAWNWLSETFEKLERFPKALNAAFESFALWHHACVLDPNNKGFAQNKQASVDRVLRLARLSLNLA